MRHYREGGKRSKSQYPDTEVYVCTRSIDVRTIVTSVNVLLKRREVASKQIKARENGSASLKRRRHSVSAAALHAYAAGKKQQSRLTLLWAGEFLTWHQIN
jgi:hypothetical protein